MATSGRGSRRGTGSTVADSPRRWPTADTSRPGGWPGGWPPGWAVEPPVVAEQNEPPGRPAADESVREAHLSRLLDEEDIDRTGHLLPRPQPSGAGELRLTSGERLRHLLAGVRLNDAVVRATVAVIRLLDPAHLDRRLPRAELPPDSSLLRPFRPLGRRPHRTRRRAGWRTPSGCWRSPRPASRRRARRRSSGPRCSAAWRPLHGEHRAVDPRSRPPDGGQRGPRPGQRGLPDRRTLTRSPGCTNALAPCAPALPGAALFGDGAYDSHATLF